jgi:hypothetical protein
MKTKLELMVGYLAGRQGDSVESIRLELRDPTSEASRWLEAVRSKSRAMLDAGSLEAQGSGPPLVPKNSENRGRARNRLVRMFLGTAAAALAFLGGVAAWRAQDESLKRLEATLRHQEARWEARFNQVDSIFERMETVRPSKLPTSREPVSREGKSERPAEPQPYLALARIEARLLEFGKRLEETTRSQAQSDPTIDQLRRELEQIGQLVEARSRASQQEMQSLNAVVQEVLQMLARLSLNSRVPDVMQVPLPVPVPPQGLLPGFGQGPGMLPGAVQDQAPGQENHRGRLDNGSDFRKTPRLQRHGGK